MAMESLARAQSRIPAAADDSNGAPDFAALLLDVREGNERAFAALWRSLNPPLVRYLRVVSGEIADDLAAETWLQVVRGLDAFDGDEPGFRSWVFTIARHRHLDWCRARARTPQIANGVADTNLVASLDDPADSAEIADGTARALRLIARLPKDQAEVITLRVVADLDVRRVARILRKRPGAVRVLAHRGLRRLADLVEREVAANDV